MVIPFRFLSIHNLVINFRGPSWERLRFVGCYRCQLAPEGGHTPSLNKAHNVESSGLQVWFEFKSERSRIETNKTAPETNLDFIAVT